MKLMQAFFFSFYMLVSPFLAAQDGIRIETYRGQEINSHIKEITDVALVVYRDYPYLYEGTVEEYLPILALNGKSSCGLGCLVYDNDKVIGAALGMPADEIRSHYLEPLLKVSSREKLKASFYFAEMLLLKEYRNSDLGQQIYNAMEKLVKAEGIFNRIYFCNIVEADQHPLKPKDYLPFDEFWQMEKLGFEKCESLTFNAYWQNINETEDSPHQQVYWTKSIAN